VPIVKETCLTTDRNSLLGGRPPKTQNSPRDLPPTRLRDPKKDSRRDGLALIPALERRISDKVVLYQLLLEFFFCSILSLKWGRPRITFQERNGL
jgi:hypothetical protein